MENNDAFAIYVKTSYLPDTAKNTLQVVMLNTSLIHELGNFIKIITRINKPDGGKVGKAAEEIIKKLTDIHISKETNNNIYNNIKIYCNILKEYIYNPPEHSSNIIEGIIDDLKKHIANKNGKNDECGPDDIIFLSNSMDVHDSDFQQKFINEYSNLLKCEAINSKIGESLHLPSSALPSGIFTGFNPFGSRKGGKKRTTRKHHKNN
jgi:hypothetical protein